MTHSKKQRNQISFSESSTDLLLPSFLPFLPSSADIPPSSCPFQPPLKQRFFQEDPSCYIHRATQQGRLLRDIPRYWLEQYTVVCNIQARKCLQSTDEAPMIPHSFSPSQQIFYRAPESTSRPIKNMHLNAELFLLSHFLWWH